MKWFGMPVEALTAVVNGHRTRVGTVYEWADKSRQDVFDIPAGEFDETSLLRQPLGDVKRP